MPTVSATTWRTLALLVLFLSGQTGLLLHQQELDEHVDNGHCQVCLHADTNNPVPDSTSVSAFRVDFLTYTLGLTQLHVPYFTNQRVNTARAPPRLS